jgi:hypothetical protein
MLQRRLNMSSAVASVNARRLCQRNAQTSNSEHVTACQPRDNRQNARNAHKPRRKP